MKKILSYGLLVLLPFGVVSPFCASSQTLAAATQPLAAAARPMLWEIGKPDSSIAEFALAPDHGDHFAKDGFFIVGRSEAARDWPYSHPGPDDEWAGNRQHTYTIVFGLKQAAGRGGSAATGKGSEMSSGSAASGDPATRDTGTCRLNVQLIDVGRVNVKLAVSINGHPYPLTLPKGAAESIWGDAAKGKKYAFTVEFPAAILKAGTNTVQLTTISGSWFIYDWLGLQAPAGIRLQPVQSSLAITGSKGLPFITSLEGREYQAAELSVLNTGDSMGLVVHVEGQPDQSLGVATGDQRLEIRVPEVAKDSTVTVSLAGLATLVTGNIALQPVKKMTIYILPHSHNDIGYTEIQTNVEKKQMNNLLTGIDYARRTRDYPEGARFVWNLEGLYAADLYLHRMNEQQKKDFFAAVKDGGVALNGMYLNTLTGLCRPEELLQLFHYSTELAQQCQVKVDAAMISDVPGYTWGTVAAMAQAGIKYFSVAPNYFDRIGDILQQWEDKPFYWVSPSGKEKVLVWIPYQGYALSHGLPGLSAGFIDHYMDVLKHKNYPYDITYIRWSGHGDNAVPDMSISDFVKDWSSRYEWPKFIISSTSTAFHAFERQYGDRLPKEQGDWTGYWEDGAGSSAFETAENRSSSSRLSQAEALWAMKGRGQYPIDSFRAAWQHVILYSEHTWGADISVTTPLSQKTAEQWAIKKSYATTADSLSRELVADALRQRADVAGAQAGAQEGAHAGAHAIDLFNTNSWARKALVLVPAALSSVGDRIKDAEGHVVPSQRLSTGELAFMAEDVPPFAAKRYFIVGGKGPVGTAVRVGAHSLDNGIIHVSLDEKTGAIASLRAAGIANDFVDSAAGDRLNDYLFLNGSNLADLQRNGPVTITVKEKGPVLAELSIESAAPGCNKLTRELRLVVGLDYVEMTDILDKKPAVLNPHPGDYAWANTQGKESLNIGFPFHVDGGAMKLDIPMAVMRPELDQIPGSCKNWLEVGNWADISNASYGITWVTLDAPLVEVGGITATLLGGQSHPEIWRKRIEPTQKLYSWALNNHWETNYRAYQDGIITFRYALQPHAAFDAVRSTEFSTGLSQPLIVAPAMGTPDNAPMLQLSSRALVVLALRPSADGKAWIVTLFNPGADVATTNLKWDAPAKLGQAGQGKIHKTYYSNTGEAALAPVPVSGIEVASQDVVTVRVEK